MAAEITWQELKRGGGEIRYSARKGAREIGIVVAVGETFLAQPWNGRSTNTKDLASAKTHVEANQSIRANG